MKTLTKSSTESELNNAGTTKLRDYSMIDDACHEKAKNILSNRTKSQVYSGYVESIATMISVEKTVEVARPLSDLYCVKILLSPLLRVFSLFFSTFMILTYF